MSFLGRFERLMATGATTGWIALVTEPSFEERCEEQRAIRDAEHVPDYEDIPLVRLDRAPEERAPTAPVSSRIGSRRRCRGCGGRGHDSRTCLDLEENRSLARAREYARVNFGWRAAVRRVAERGGQEVFRVRRRVAPGDFAYCFLVLEGGRFGVASAPPVWARSVENRFSIRTAEPDRA